MTVSAAVRLSPYPPALRLMRKVSGPFGDWNFSTSLDRSLVVPSR